MTQLGLFEEIEDRVGLDENSNAAATSGTFKANVNLPVHRWFRYSAGFSGAWVKELLKEKGLSTHSLVLDPFSGAGTTVLECEFAGVPSVGLDPHPFVAKVARAKLCWKSDPHAFRAFADKIIDDASRVETDPRGYPELVERCYSEDALKSLHQLRIAVERAETSSPAGSLAWLALAAILRPTSKAGTAQWQYVLPAKTKKRILAPFDAFRAQCHLMMSDMKHMQDRSSPVPAALHEADARTCTPVAAKSVDFVISSPPYPNNFDYADATRLEMCFFKEISSWSDLQIKVRRHLVRACSQHVPTGSTNIDEVLALPELSPIRNELSDVCAKLSDIRLQKSGKKTYNNMIACYYADMAQTWTALRRVCKAGAQVCFVIGDSAPYGVYAPAVEWMGRLALGAGFRTWRFEKLRDRNVKWKNRKHRVPLLEGRLWVEG